jgi:hypothetical protein
MSNAQEKRVNRIAELKGFRLERAGHGKPTAVSTSRTWLRAEGCGPAFVTTSIPFLWRKPKRGLLKQREFYELHHHRYRLSRCIVSQKGLGCGGHQKGP